MLPVKPNDNNFRQFRSRGRDQLESVQDRFYILNPEKRLKNKFEVKIITETLADIFARQGNYFDAMEAYTYLLKIKPERKEILESKISEVEIQINKLINDF